MRPPPSEDLPSTHLFGLPDAQAARLLTLNLKEFLSYHSYVPPLPDTLVSPITNFSSFSPPPPLTMELPVAYSPISPHLSEHAYIRRMHPDVHFPTKSSPFSVGYDLYSPVSVSIPPHGRVTISTGLQVIPPDGTYTRIAGRSGLASSLGLFLGGGVVDPDYRGQLQVILFNSSPHTVSIQPGDRIAQMVFERCSTPHLSETTAPPPPSARDQGGLGSSGLLQHHPSASSLLQVIPLLPFFSLSWLSSLLSPRTTSCSSDVASDDLPDMDDDTSTPDAPPTQPDLPRYHASPPAALFTPAPASVIHSPTAHTPTHSPSPEPESQLEALALDPSDDTPQLLVQLQCSPPTPPTWTTIKPRPKTKVTPDRSSTKKKIPPVKLTFPSRQLAEVGLFSHYLIFTPIAPHADNPSSQPFSLKACLTVVEDACRRDEGIPSQRPFAFLPLSSVTFDPARRIHPTPPDPKARLSRFNSATDNLFLKPESERTLYTIYDPDHAPAGYHVRILTPLATKKEIQQLCPATRCHATIFQPRDQPPDVLPCLRNKPTERFYPIGWLLFSSRHISLGELSSTLELYLHTAHPNWIWLPRILKVYRQTVATLDSPNDRTQTTALWIAICDPSLLVEIDKDLRTLFSKPTLDRPLGRPMHYIPRDLFSSTDIDNPTPSSDTKQWNDYVHWQSIYWEQGEQYCQYSTHDPYEILSDARGRTTSTRSLALSLAYTAPDTQRNSHLFVGFDRDPARPYPRPYGTLRSHVPVPIALFDFDRHINNYSSQDIGSPSSTPFSTSSLDR